MSVHKNVLKRRTCRICLGLHGQVREPGQPFTFEGKEYYKPTAHPFCRCRLLPQVVEGEGEKIIRVNGEQSLHKQQGLQMLNLEASTMVDMIGLYIRARESLRDSWEQSWTMREQKGAPVRFTEARTLKSLRMVEEEIQTMQAEMKQTLYKVDTTATDMAFLHMGEYIGAFEGLDIPRPDKKVAHMVTVKKLLANRIQKTVSRYGSDVLRLFREELMLGLLTDKSIPEITGRIMESLPAGNAAWKEWNAVVDGKKIAPNRLKTRIGGAYYWAERIARTEVMDAYGAAEEVALVEADKSAKRLGLKMMQKWDAAWEIPIEKAPTPAKARVRPSKGKPETVPVVVRRGKIFPGERIPKP